MQRLWDTPLQAFREDPRFRDLMRTAGLTDYWRRYGWADICGEGAQMIDCS
jgi:hypothetical protein